MLPLLREPLFLTCDIVFLYEKSNSIGVVYTCSLLREDGDCFVRRRVVLTPADFTGTVKLVSVIESVDTVDEVEDAVEDSVLFRF